MFCRNPYKTHCVFTCLVFATFWASRLTQFCNGVVTVLVIYIYIYICIYIYSLLYHLLFVTVGFVVFVCNGLDLIVTVCNCVCVCVLHMYTHMHICICLFMGVPQTVFA